MHGYIMKGYCLARWHFHHSAAVKVKFFRIHLVCLIKKTFRIHHLRSGSDNLVLQVTGCIINSHTCHIGCAGGIRPWVKRWNICIYTCNNKLINVSQQRFSRNLGHRCITSGSHIRCTNLQCIEAIIIELDFSTGCIYIWNTRTLHGNRHTDSSDFCWTNLFAWIFLVPSDHVPTTLDTTIQCTAVKGFIVISRHDFAHTQHILLSKQQWIHIQHMCQFIHSGFQCKLPLCRTIAPKCSRRHHVRVNTAVFESMGSRLIVQRDCFMTGQTNGRCTMFAVSTLVRQCI